MADTLYISKITLPTGTTYSIKDAELRETVESLAGINTVTWLGITTTNLTDGATSATISVDGKNVTAKGGGLAVHDQKEFIYNGSKWQELGDLSILENLGSFAYANTGTASYTPGGSVSGDFSGKATTFTGSFTPAGNVTGSFKGTQGDISASYTPAGDVTVTTSTTTNNNAGSSKDNG